MIRTFCVRELIAVIICLSVSRSQLTAQSQNATAGSKLNTAVAQATPVGSFGKPQDLTSAKFAVHTVWIPYWSEKDGHHAVLHLRNGLHHYALTAVVEVMSQQGRVLATQSINLQKLANVDLALQSVLPAGSSDAVRSGSIRISYSYPYDGVLQAELSIRDDTRNHAYTIVGRKSSIGTSKNAYLAIHRPTKQTYLEMAFTNPSESAEIAVRLSIRRDFGWKPLNEFSLKPTEH